MTPDSTFLIHGQIAGALGWHFFDGWHHPDGRTELPNIDEMISELCTDIQRLRAERRWIAVEERLPKEKVSVLCIDSLGVIMVAWIGWGEWRCPEIEGEITHWMPLPPLPEKEVQG